ncbi:triphosphoribosyl-dephospho-CoA synthase [Halocatena pleomorpha]|uniref:Triphosphoribosyl-dephospho-CoA synthase n=1 Tax=Halocatena pleomorpha TaxID=1785090 RepID=A0A3P3RDV1_9EURY|nr:triphosphoribosyl-dephospho-CoA synthase [Halocatena pleomorpha]RRJ31687.1 triphosphoribosyl-dephospho-CoA synthase [Halocatena pleomorpha]
MRSPAQNAQLALLLELSGTPKPGNVDRRHEYNDLRFEHFMAGAVGSTPGLLLAQQGAAVGRAFERGVVGMAEQRGGNTQFGALLLLVPLVQAASADSETALTPEPIEEIVHATTVEDACDFYRAFEHVDVGVDDPPPELTALDVRRGARAASTLRERGLTLFDVMELSADVDGVAREWTEAFPRSFRAADWIEAGDGPISDRAADAYLRLLASEPDTFVVKRHDHATAEEVVERAQAALDGTITADDLATEFIRREINPGTTADITAAALFLALEQGVSV